MDNNLESLIKKYKLPENQNKEILNTKILPLVFNNMPNMQKHPVAIILGGQTGAR